LEKSGIFIGGLIGATIVLLTFTFVMIPPPIISPPDLIATNGHSVSTVGEETPIFSSKELSFIEIFDRSEQGVVRVNASKCNKI